jgi:glyoxylate/hydroxypyruvate reductase A
MKTLLVGARANPQVWADLFRAELPGHRILVEAPPAGVNVEYVVVGRPPPGLIASLAGLELVLSLNAGIEVLLAPGAVPPHIPIVRMADPGLTEGMVEWVLAQTFAWHRNLFAYAASQAEGVWAPRPEKLARERTVVVLGAGALGVPVAQALADLNFRTRIWSRTAKALAGIETFAGPEGFRDALEGADVLVSVLPHTAETDGLLNAAAFARLAPGGFVVNGGRGGAIVDADLIAALDSGHLAGAALDVFRQEPLPADHPFWRHPGVRLSPHVAAPTHPHTAVAVMAESVRRWERGEPLEHVADRALGY